jgi:transcription elongation factor Elf1
MKIREHVFEKQNLVTVVKGRKNYDTYKCTICGITVKSYGLSTPHSTKLCKEIEKPEPSGSIKIIDCYACGKQFANLIPDSIHTIIDPPSGYVNNDKGVWVMGVGEPVKVLNDEFILL